MTIRLNLRWLLLPALLFSLQFCRAQVVVPPSITFELGGTNSSASQLWDLNGSYSLNFTVVQGEAAVPVQLTFTLIQSPNGKLSNASNEVDTLTISDNALAIFTHITGKVTGSGGSARVHMTVHFNGNGGTLGGHAVTAFGGMFTIDAEASAAADSPDGIPELVGNKPGKFTASFPGVVNIRGQVQDFVAPLLPGVDGSWKLTLNMVGLNKITGTAVAVTPSESLGFNLGGPFKGGIFNLKARGANGIAGAQNGAGASANIFLTPDFNSITLNGRILGQKMFFGFP